LNEHNIGSRCIIGWFHVCFTMHYLMTVVRHWTMSIICGSSLLSQRLESIVALDDMMTLVHHCIQILVFIINHFISSVSSLALVDPSSFSIASISFLPPKHDMAASSPKLDLTDFIASSTTLYLNSSPITLFALLQIQSTVRIFSFAIAQEQFTNKVKDLRVVTRKAINEFN